VLQHQPLRPLQLLDPLKQLKLQQISTPSLELVTLWELMLNQHTLLLKHLYHSQLHQLSLANLLTQSLSVSRVITTMVRSHVLFLTQQARVTTLQTTTLSQLPLKYILELTETTLPQYPPRKSMLLPLIPAEPPQRQLKSLLMDLLRELLTPLSVLQLTDMPHSQATLPMPQMTTTPQFSSPLTEPQKKTTTMTLPPALEYLYSS